MRSDRKKRAVLIISGGMDSCVLAHYYAAAGFHLHLLSFLYGQRHVKEILYAQKQYPHLQERYPHLEIGHQILRLPIADAIPDSDSALLNTRLQLPHGHYTDESMKATVVPYRNPNMLLQAATVAWNSDASMVAYAAHQGDYAQYPDCRDAFVRAFSAMITTAMPEKTITVEAPFLRFTKAQIACLGAQLRVPFELTWSCYEGGQEGSGDLHCGRCGTCVERWEAFHLAGLLDPTQYASEPGQYLY